MSTIRLSLWAGVLAPVLYFGAQAVGWAFYPGYDPLTQVASERARRRRRRLTSSTAW